MTLPNLTGADWLANRETQRVLGAIEAAGFSARVVGGCVRNALMGLPVTDIDIATTALPVDVQKIAKAAGLASIPTGIEHGTITVVANHVPYEVTTLRRDVTTDGRRATVAFTDDWAEDAARRDFTMNALYCDARGTVHDPLGGYADVLARHVRFIGNAEERIAEDYLRILRFFRFHATYGRGELDSAGADACVGLRGGLAYLSGERVGAETLRLLVAERAVPVIEAMAGLGLLVPVLTVPPDLQRFARLVAIEDALSIAPEAALRLAALAVRDTDDVQRLTDRLRLSKDQQSVLRLAAQSGGRLSSATNDREARVALYRLGAEDYRRRGCLDLAWDDDPVTDGNWRRLLSLPERAPVPPFPLAGRDLLALGMAPGPAVGKLLAELEQHWIDSDFTADADELRNQATSEIARIA
jgi:poly(A) polymerase